MVHRDEWTVAASSTVVAQYQPIVRLDDASLVGFEALARWSTAPAQSLSSVFDGVAASEDVSALDWACRQAALVGALDSGVDQHHLLFVNVEPVVLGRGAPPGFVEILSRARRHLRVVVELTERHLLAHPAELLAFAEWVREQGWGLALDDVGVDSESLAALPFLDPDVIKLDMSLIHKDPDVDQARTLTAVLAHSERSGAELLAEGIETSQHLEQARTIGAALGQGYLFGAPGPLPRPVPAAATIRVKFRQSRVLPLPATLLETDSRVRLARKSVLQRLSRQLEAQARNAADPSVLLATFQHIDWFGARELRRYIELAEVCRFVGVLGVGMPPEPGAGVRGADLDSDDPLAAEWIVIVLGAHYAAALIAREVDTGDDESEHDRRFRFILTHDRDTVVAVGQDLLRHFVDA